MAETIYISIHTHTHTHALGFEPWQLERLNERSPEGQGETSAHVGK